MGHELQLASDNPKIERICHYGRRTRKTNCTAAQRITTLPVNKPQLCQHRGGGAKTIKLPCATALPPHNSKRKKEAPCLDHSAVRKATQESTRPIPFKISVVGTGTLPSPTHPYPHPCQTNTTAENGCTSSKTNRAEPLQTKCATLPSAKESYRRQRHPPKMKVLPASISTAQTSPHISASSGSSSTTT